MKSNIYCIPKGKSPLEITGKGAKGLLIVIQATDKQKNINTLQGLVKAIKFDIEEDATIVSMDQSTISLNSILAEHKPNTIILIGTPPAQVGFSINAKKNFFYKMEQFSILLTDSLEDMNAEKSKKMAFWQCLQSKFLS